MSDSQNLIDLKELFSIALSGDVNRLNVFLTETKFENIGSLIGNEPILNKVIKSSLSTINKINIINLLMLNPTYASQLKGSQDEDGNTAIHVACKLMNIDLIKFLIDKGFSLFSSNANSKHGPAIKYLASGKIEDCEPTKVEDIIDKPVAKFDKKRISELDKKIKDFYNNELFEDAYIEDIGFITRASSNLAIGSLKKRLMNYFKNIKSSVEEELKESKKFKELQIQLLEKITRIMSNAEVNDEEKELEIIKLKNDLYEDVLKILTVNDPDLLKSIDLKPTSHVYDSDGLYLAYTNGRIKKFLKPPPPGAGLPNNNLTDNLDEALLKLSDKPTLNQHLSNERDKNIESLRTLKEKITTDLTMFNQTINLGVKQACNSMANLKTSINNIWMVWVFNNFHNNRAGALDFNIPPDFDNIFSRRKKTKYFLTNGAGNNLDLIEDPVNYKKYESGILNNFQVDELSYYNLKNINEDGKIVFNLNDSHKEKLFEFQSSKSAIYISNNQTLMENNLNFIKMNTLPPNINQEFNLRRYFKVNEVVLKTKSLIRQSITNICRILGDTTQKFRKPISESLTRAKAELALEIQKYYEKSSEWWDVTAAILQKDRLFRDIVIKSNDYWNKVALVQHSSNLIENIFFKPLPDALEVLFANTDLDIVNPIDWDPLNAQIPPIPNPAHFLNIVTGNAVIVPAGVVPPAPAPIPITSAPQNDSHVFKNILGAPFNYYKKGQGTGTNQIGITGHYGQITLILHDKTRIHNWIDIQNKIKTRSRKIIDKIYDDYKEVFSLETEQKVTRLILTRAIYLAAANTFAEYLFTNQTANPLVNGYAPFNDIDQVAKARKIFSSIVVLLMEYPIEGSNVNQNGVNPVEFEYLTIERARSDYTRKVFGHTFSHYNVFSMAYYMMYEYGRILPNNPNDIRKYLHSCSLYKNICLIGHRGAVGGNMPFSYGYKEGANNYNDNGLDIISRCYYTIHNLEIGNVDYDSYDDSVQYKFDINAIGILELNNSILYQGNGANYQDHENWAQVPSDFKPPGAVGQGGNLDANSAVDRNWLDSIWFDKPGFAPFWNLNEKINLINIAGNAVNARERLFIDNPQRQNLEITMSNNRRFKIPRLQNDLRFIDINNNDYTKLLIEKPDPLLPLAIIGKRFNDQIHKTNETFDNIVVVVGGVDVVPIIDYTNFRSNIQNIAPAPLVAPAPPPIRINRINTPNIDNYPNHMNDFDRSWSWVPPGTAPNNPTKTLNSSRTDFQREIPKPDILKPYRSTNYFQTQTGGQLYSDKLINSLLKNAVSSSEINKRDQILNSAKELLVKIWNGNGAILQDTLTPITVGIDGGVYNFPDIANDEIIDKYENGIVHNNKLPHPYNISQPNQRSLLSRKYNDIIRRQNASPLRAPGQYYDNVDIKLDNIVTDYKNSVKNYNGAPVDLKNKSDYAHEFVYGYRHYQELIIYLPEVLFGGSVPKQLENSENNDIEGNDISKIADFRTYINNNYIGVINFDDDLMERFKAMYDNAIDDPDNNNNLDILGINNQVNEERYANLVNIWAQLDLPPLPDNLFTSNLENIKEAWSTFITIDKNSIRSNFNSVKVEQLTNALMVPITQIILDNFGVENNTINQISKFEIEFKDNSDFEIKIFDKDQIPFNVTQEDFSLGTYKNNRVLNLFNDGPNNVGSFDLTPQGNGDDNYKFFTMKSNTFKNLNDEFQIGSVNDEFILLPLIALGENILSKNLIVNTLLNEFDSLFDGNKITIDQDNLKNFLFYFIKVIVRYYCTIDLFYDEIKTEFDNSLDKINDKFKERLAKTSLGKQNELNKMILNFKNDIIDQTRLDNTLGKERSDIEMLTKNLISYVNSFTKELNKHVYLENIYQYWNSNSHINIFLNRTLDLIPDIELNSTKILLNKNFFGKFNEDVISKVNFAQINNNNNPIKFNKIGINYEAPTRGLIKFNQVYYNTGIIDKYYSKTRYRILEEILLYTAAKLKDRSTPNSFKKIFEEVEKSFGDKIGIISLEDKYRKSLILSIFGDMIDNYLISNVTKVIENQVRTEVNKIYDTNNSTPLKEFEFGQANAKINYRALSFDTEFGLNLYDFDDIVDNLLLDPANSEYHKMMSYGDSVVEFNKIEQDKFYPSDFLPIIINKSKCFKSYNYDNSSNIIEYIKGKEVPTYNIDVLFRAIQAGNVDFIKQVLQFENYNASIYSQKDISGKNIVDIQLISFMSLLEFFGKSEKNKIFFLPNYINKINEAYSIYLKDTIKKIGSHKNVVMNYDKLILLNLYMYNLEFYQSFYNKQEYSAEIINAKDPFDEYLKTKLSSPTIENDIDNNLTYKYKFELLKDESTFYKNKKKYFENKIEEIKEDMDKLDEISKRLGKFPSTPIINDKTKIDEEYEKLEKEKVKFEEDLEKLGKLGNVAKAKTNLSPNLDTNLFNKVVVLSKIDNGQTLDTSQFLNYLSEINKDDNDINLNPFFIHNFVCSKIYAILKDLKDNNLTATSIRTNKVKLENIKEVYENIKTHVETKNGLSRDIIKNENLKKEFNRICFTIDMVVGNAFLKVLRRYVIKFLQTRYPTSEKDKGKKEVYAKFILDSAEKMLQSIEKYIQPDIDVGNNKDVKYTPSKLTKSLILSNLNYKIGDNGDISIKDETELFRYVIDLFLGNPFEKISSRDPMIKHLEKILIPYFKDYYRICITTIGASINGYENYVMSIYKNLDILILLLDKFDEGTQKTNNMTPVLSITDF